MNIRLLGNRIAVRMDDAKTVSSGGIQLVKEEQANSGTVVAVGPGLYNNQNILDPTSVQVGDHISFLTDNLIAFNLGDEDLMMLTEEDIIAILDNK